MRYSGPYQDFGTPLAAGSMEQVDLAVDHEPRCRGLLAAGHTRSSPSLRLSHRFEENLTGSATVPVSASSRQVRIRTSHHFESPLLPLKPPTIVIRLPFWPGELRSCMHLPVKGQQPGQPRATGHALYPCDWIVTIVKWDENAARSVANRTTMKAGADNQLASL